MTKKTTGVQSGRIAADSGHSRHIGRVALVATAAAAALFATTTAAGAIAPTVPANAPATVPANGIATSATGHAVSAAPQRIGSVARIPNGAVRTGIPAGSTPVQLDVGLQPRDPQALKDFIAAVSTKGNPEYHRYLAKGQFGAAFGPTQQAVGAVTAALRAQGLKPGKLSADGLSLPVSTTLAAAAHAFGTGFADYRLPDGTTGYSDTAAPQIAGTAADYVSGVSGLNSLARYQPQYQIAPKEAAPNHSAAAPTTPQASSAGPELCATAAKTLNRSFGADGNRYYSAGNLARSYDMDHTSTTGAGMTVGVFELEGYAASNLAAYQSCYGTHVPVTDYRVDGGPNTTTGTESLLDLEDLASLLPGASLIDYEGPSRANATVANWLDTYQAMVLDDRAQVLSISWAGCEAYTDPSILTAEDYYSQEAAAQGQTILASTGDTGATGCWQNGGSEQSAAAVEDPASQPYVIGVGGTSLDGNPAAYRSTWNSEGGGTGGGVSSIWSFPNGAADYQSGFTGRGYTSSACKAPSGSTCRQVPDVSALADPDEGYPVYYDGSWGVTGGTSGAAPTWAAVIAIADSQSACQANGPLGFVTPALYAAARTSYATDYTDITTGNNIVHSGVGYAAGAGYDLATGLGEPKAAALAGTLCAALPVATGGASTYHPVTPTRLLDTRTTGTVPAGGMTGVQIGGNAGIPASGVTEAVLNVTVTGTTGAGHLVAWGDKAPRPATSNLNWDHAGQTISNLVTVPVPSDGKVDFYTTSATQVIADVQGYYTADTSGDTFTSTAPTRVLDTRVPLGTATAGPVSFNTISLKVDGQNGVPSNAQAVVLNLTTAFAATSGGYLEAYPEGATAPTVSNVNWSAKGALLSGLAVVPVGADGNVSIKVNGSTNVIADVFGYFTADTSGATFTGVSPARLLDTRSTGGAVPAGHTLTLQVTGVHGIPSGIKSVVLNLTVTGNTSAGFLEAWADGTTRPAAASNVNWLAGQTIPNQVILPVGADGKVDLYVNSTTQVIADAFGYFN